MTEFRVHFIKSDGNKTTHVVNADSPGQAAAMIRRKNPGVNVTKVKVNKAGNVSVRQAVKSGLLPEFKVGTAPKNFNVQDGDKGFIEGVGNVTMKTVIMDELSEVDQAGNVSVRGAATNWKVEPHRPLTAEDFHNQFMQETDGIETMDIAVLGDEFVTTIVTRRG